MLKSARDALRLLNGVGSAITIFSDMPTYEYRCEKCQGTFELFQSMKDAALEVCPKEQCRLDTWGHGKVKRLLGTGAGLIFKGSGFYVTDYRSPSYKESVKKESGAKEGGTKESGGGKTDSGGAKSGEGTSSTGGGTASSSNKPAN
ncbi:MAG: FmdB family zinc ribbon protein [Chthoniobacterales bacterium]